MRSQKVPRIQRSVGSPTRSEPGRCSVSFLNVVDVYDRADFLTWAYDRPNSQWDNQPHCNVRGFNVDVSLDCRYGIMMNNENDCNSCDSWVGFGCSGLACSADTWSQTIETVHYRGWIFVR